jgi:hypothetical protein
MNKSAFLAPALLVLVGAGLPVVACSSNQNHGERDTAPEAQGRPDYSNMDPMYLLQQCIGPEAGRPSINGQPPACTPDPGSRPVDMAKAEGGYQFAWLWDVNAAALGRSTFTYDDNTADFVLPDPKLAWEPPAYPIAAVAAVNAPFPYTFAARFKGGPFREYGGGFGQSLRTSINGDDKPTDSTGKRVADPTVANPPDLPPSPDYPVAGYGAYDLRKWTGVAIWVRRGPLGQPTMRIGVTDKHSAEDLNSEAMRRKAVKEQDETFAASTGIQEAKYCKRWRLCGCSGGTPCSPIVSGSNVTYACFDPAIDVVDAAAMTVNGKTLVYNGTPGVQVCGPTRCRQNNTSSETADPLFASLDETGSVVDAKCTVYQTSDGKTDSFCYDPAKDPPPPAKRERCNNPFSKPFTVTTDWQLIKVPFTELLQADEGLVSDEFDLSSIKQVVVTYGGGWTDFYVANFGFYRKL